MKIFGGFFGMSKEQAEGLMSAGLLNIRSFEKRQILMDMDGEPDEMGILLSGRALLESTNLDDQRRILNYYGTQDLFYRKAFPDLEKGSYYVVSKTKCQVAYVNYAKLTAGHSAHGMRTRLLDEMVMTSQRRLLVHVDILGQRTMRQKLMAYFSYLSHEAGSNSFEMPISLTDCADYLSVDRSAMMRELGKMKAEGLIRKQGSRIEI